MLDCQRLASSLHTEKRKNRLRICVLRWLIKKIPKCRPCSLHFSYHVWWFWCRMMTISFSRWTHGFFQLMPLLLCTWTVVNFSTWKLKTTTDSRESKGTPALPPAQEIREFWLIRPSPTGGWGKRAIAGFHPKKTWQAAGLNGFRAMAIAGRCPGVLSPLKHSRNAISMTTLFLGKDLLKREATVTL